jgi:3-oxoacyl-(acyl-carrier-protein) synthase
MTPGLDVVASARAVGRDQPPPVPKFIVSDFAPLVYAAVRRCIGAPESAHLLHGHGERAGLVLSSRRFDTVTLELSVEQARQRRISPILFYQVLPTAILGQVAIDYGMTGPVSCLASTGDARAEALEVALLLLADDSADWMIAMTAGLADDPADSFATADLVRRAAPGDARVAEAP